MGILDGIVEWIAEQVLNGLDLYPDNTRNSTEVMFVNFGRKESLAALKAVKEMRAAGIAAEIYPDTAKMKKQMAYADYLGARYTAIIGEAELASDTIALKDMESGEQRNVSVAEAISILRP
ncbi:MAG: hypothetical protein K2F71_05420 [Paramuribaculum sp.]|nr:hypothetical protein [Paramuribaculum sp.]